MSKANRLIRPITPQQGHPMWFDTVHNIMRDSTPMHEDDMSFMKEVFIPDDQGNEKPRLPYNQYIVSWGLHPVCLEVKDGGALAAMMEKYGLSFRAKYKIPRPSGMLVNLSVISGMMFYSRKGAPYEILCSADEDEDGTNYPRAYQTDEDLMLLIAKLLTEGDDNGLSK